MQWRVEHRPKSLDQTEFLLWRRDNDAAQKYCKSMRCYLSVCVIAFAAATAVQAARAQSTPPRPPKDSNKVTKPATIRGASQPGTGSRKPLCRDVGGYSAYLQQTGKVCVLGADAYRGRGYRMGR